MTGPDDGVGARWGKVPLRVTVDLGVGHGYALGVFCVLAAHANRDGECWPAQSTIAALLGVSPRTVGRAVKVLRARGHVVVLEQGGGRRVTRYLLPGLRVDTGVAPGRRRRSPVVGRVAAEEHLEQMTELPVTAPPRRLIERARAGVWRGLADEAEP